MGTFAACTSPSHAFFPDKLRTAQTMALEPEPIFLQQV
eukprot:CAMPEP_0172684682 /NCGR_PEP_ID=MMETSP1074-20121228/19733_1 /TAXON_ID=2916 /ORGANISM="Ceratium fusus, Strain PA161109" /LENGTH=37 /DNA_ID= /DNA_START= /DNA_END= /DNA_ORIENTATION=